MICEKCGVNKATTHIRTVVNGVVYDKYLCNHCAATENNHSNNFVHFFDLLFDEKPQNVKNQVVCSGCGTRFDDIVNTGKCGCAECYSTFYEQLLPYLKKIHGSTKHIGKNLNDKDNATLNELRDMLKQFVKDEKYEEAAVLRDKIKAMESEAK